MWGCVRSASRSVFCFCIAVFRDRGKDPVLSVLVRRPGGGGTPRPRTRRGCGTGCARGPAPPPRGGSMPHPPQHQAIPHTLHPSIVDRTPRWTAPHRSRSLEIPRPPGGGGSAPRQRPTREPETTRAHDEWTQRGGHGGFRGGGGAATRHPPTAYVRPPMNGPTEEHSTP